MTVGTIVRTIVLFLAIINQVLAIFGKSIIPIQEEDINLLVTTAWTVISAIIAWWENNSFTKAAIEADKVYYKLKNQNGSEEV